MKSINKSIVALRKESVDRNVLGFIAKNANSMSLSARRAWIEIPAGCWRDARRAVALRKESVDRNEPSTTRRLTNRIVALRKESVDRNAKRWNSTERPVVALRKESVDRNFIGLSCID